MRVDHRKEGEENDYEPDCILDPDVIVFRQQGNRQSVRFPVWDPPLQIPICLSVNPEIIGQMRFGYPQHQK